MKYFLQHMLLSFLLLISMTSWSDFHGAIEHPEYQEILNRAAQESKPILLLFTGTTCKNILFTNEIIKKSKKINTILSTRFLYLKLEIDDHTPLLKSEQYISSGSNRIVRTIGGRNADLEMTVFNNNSAPYYVILNSAGKVISTSTYMASEAEILKFLNQKL